MSYRILIVEDNPTNLKLASQVLEVEGYVVIHARDAQQAQELLQHMPPDLILMDIALPDMDGLTLTRRIKAIERLQHIPIIAMTAFAMKGDDRKAFESGCDGYITKPIDTRQFPRQVAAFLRPNTGNQEEFSP